VPKQRYEGYSVVFEGPMDNDRTDLIHLGNCERGVGMLTFLHDAAWKFSEKRLYQEESAVGVFVDHKKTKREIQATIL
jgi:hypothetical protein